MSKLLLSSIRADGATQPRAHLDEAVVTEYAEAMVEGAKFPPLVVFYDGSVHWLADGFHRYRAMYREGFVEVDVDIKQGSQRDAILYSVGANSEHGLRRTNEDKRRAVLRLLEDEEWGKWSDREIARRCAVGHPLVAEIRASLTGSSSSEPPAPRTYTTKHGTTATMDTSRIGHAPKQDKPLDWTNPEPPAPEPAEFRKPVEEEPAPEEPPTPADDAIRDAKIYLDMILDEMSDDTQRLFFANETIKYLRTKAIEYNRLS